MRRGKEAYLADDWAELPVPPATPGRAAVCITDVNGRFSAYDSPELATLLSKTARQSRWRVESGGRIGMDLGEDAVEDGCNPRRIISLDLSRRRWWVRRVTHGSACLARDSCDCEVRRRPAREALRR